jgi:hypothetical protein
MTAYDMLTCYFCFQGRSGKLPFDNTQLLPWRSGRAPRLRHNQKGHFQSPGHLAEGLPRIRKLQHGYNADRKQKVLF